MPTDRTQTAPPRENLAAQKITLLLNLNLDEVLVDPAMAIMASWWINIDPLADLPSGDIYDPVATTGGELGSCTIVDTTDCDPPRVLNDLGLKVAALDLAGTTVQEILDAADDLIATGTDPQDVNGVDLTKGDLTKILGLINESFDEGDITGFVTAVDDTP